MNGRPKPFVIGPDGGEAYWFLGNLGIIRADGRATGGRYGLFEALLPKDAAPPLHSHPQDETFIILDGEMDVWVGGEQHRCDQGSTFMAPGHSPHTFLVRSETARVLTLSTPAGIEELVRAFNTPAKERRLPPDELFPSREEIAAVYRRLEITIHGPPPAPDAS
jgi:quercetin dioxygenase-like cupin family protein